MTRGDMLVRLAVAPARIFGLFAALPLMAAPFILAWTALIRVFNGAWPPASVADLLSYLHAWTPPGAHLVPVWLALGVVGYLGLKLSDWLASASLKLLDRLAGGRADTAPTPDSG